MTYFLTSSTFGTVAETPMNLSNGFPLDWLVPLSNDTDALTVFILHTIASIVGPRVSSFN